MSKIGKYSDKYKNLKVKKNVVSFRVDDEISRAMLKASDNIGMSRASWIQMVLTEELKQLKLI